MQVGTQHNNNNKVLFWGRVKKRIAFAERRCDHVTAAVLRKYMYYLVLSF